MATRKDPTKRSAQGTGAYKSKIKYQDERNEQVYDRLTVRLPKGYKEKLLDYMTTKIKEITILENMENRTEDQENLLQELKVLYTVSDRGTPSVNNLIINLLRKETGID